MARNSTPRTNCFRRARSRCMRALLTQVRWLPGTRAGRRARGGRIWHWSRARSAACSPCGLCIRRKESLLRPPAGLRCNSPLTHVRAMADNNDTYYPTAEQHRERAKLLRGAAETMSSETRRQLLDIAQEYELLADLIERDGSANG
jgi:hypothetical protein